MSVVSSLWSCRMSPCQLGTFPANTSLCFVTAANKTAEGWRLSSSGPSQPICKSQVLNYVPPPRSVRKGNYTKEVIGHQPVGTCGPARVLNGVKSILLAHQSLVIVNQTSQLPGLGAVSRARNPCWPAPGIS